MGPFNSSFLQQILRFITGSNNSTNQGGVRSQTSLTNTIQRCSSASSSEQKRVLLISADSGNRDELVDQLDTWGYQTVTCRSPEEAINRLAKPTEHCNPFHFLILDSRRLVVEPREFASQLQTGSLLEQLTIILVGPHLSDQEQASLKSAGYHYQVATPLNKRVLFAALQSSAYNTDATAGVTNLLDRYQKAHPKVSPKKILLAAYDSETCERAAKILENEGHAVRVAKDGHQALDALETDIFDLAIIDVELPSLSGIQVINIHHLDCPIDQWMPFILLLEEDTHSNQYYQYSRIKACICKPINTQHLIKTLYELIKQQDQTHESLPPETALVNQHPLNHRTARSTVLLDRSILKELESIDETNNNFIHQIVHLFEEDGQRTLHELAKAVKQHDIILFKEMAHLLLDGASLLGAKKLHKLSLCASQISQEDFTNHADRMVNEIQATFNATDYELIQYLSEKTDSLSRS